MSRRPHPATLKAPGSKLADIKVQGIGYGIGLGVAFVMQEVSSLMSNHSQQIMETISLAVCMSIIGSAFHKSLRLSRRARVEHTMGQMMRIISTDLVCLNRIWTSPIQIIISLRLLIKNLGYSTLASLGAPWVSPTDLVHVMFEGLNTTLFTLG
ncbi:hypothetical protein C8R45DRAFT_1106497 [Mycena sanguinolenta]|nr:hypothetical protein C8R45DRAFT_1106497 [Mycena sanguinolenta]